MRTSGFVDVILKCYLQTIMGGHQSNLKFSLCNFGNFLDVSLICIESLTSTQPFHQKRHYWRERERERGPHLQKTNDTLKFIYF